MTTPRRRHDSVTAEARFRARVIELGGQVIGSWVRNVSPILIVCSLGHESKVVPSNLDRGQGICPICATRLRAKRMIAKSSATFSALARRDGVTLLDAYVGARQGIRALCAVGHEIYPIPNNIKRGWSWCAECNNRQFDRIYLLRFGDSGWSKVGITGNIRRIQEHEHRGYILLRQWVGISHRLAIDVERAVLGLRDDLGGRPGPIDLLPLDGITETFSSFYLPEVIGLVDSWLP